MIGAVDRYEKLRKKTLDEEVKKAVILANAPADIGKQLQLAVDRGADNTGAEAL